MRCPACGNEIYKRIDYALVQCTQCGGLWDAQMYPGFPVPKVEPLAIWDTSELVDDVLFDGEDDQDDDSNESEDEQEKDVDNDDFDNWDIDGEEENSENEEKFDDRDCEDENEQVDDN